MTTLYHYTCEHGYLALGADGHLIAPSEHWPSVRRDFSAKLRDGLESAPGVMPMHWWIACTHVPVVFDPILAATGRVQFGGTS